MRRMCIFAVCAMAVMLAGCGGSSNNGINGNWTATLTNLDGSVAFTLTATLTQSNGTLNITNLSFGASSSCFALGTTATGAFTASGTTNNVTSGTFQMTIQSGTANSNGTNQLTLQGILSNNTITGTWTLTGTGSGCTGSGNLTMSNSGQ